MAVCIATASKKGNVICGPECLRILAAVTRGRVVCQETFNSRGSRRKNVSLDLQKWQTPGFLGGSGVNNPSTNAGDMGSIPDPGGCHRATKPMCHNY